MSLLLNKKAAPDGKWFTHSFDEEDPKNEKPIRFKVRTIPSAEVARIEARHMGKKQRVERRDGSSIHEVDLEKSREVLLDKAEYALLDCENCTIVIDGTEDARRYEAASPAADGRVTLDGKLGEDGVKWAFLEDAYETTDVVGWIIKKATGLQRSAAKEESFLERT